MTDGVRIRAEGLSKKFGESQAVRNVSFEVARGEALVLVGESGCGKTTTLKMINRLVEPDAGTVSIDDRDAASMPPHLLRRRVGYVLQNAALFPHMTVRENIALPLELLGWEHGRVDARVKTIMTLLEIESALSQRSPTELSGGQAQRVGLARAIATEPDIVLLDEPFGALDPLTRDRLQQSFSALRRSLGLTVILVTHDMAEAFILADRIGVMQHGELVQVGTPPELLSTPAAPYVELLLDSPRRHARAFELK